MINSVVLVGRLTNDPEMKYTPNGMAITTFRLAVDRGRKSESGEDQTDYLNIVCFQKTAELVAQWLDKGALVGIEGRIQSRTWEGQDGKRNTWVEIVANNVRFLESKAEAERRRSNRGQSGPGGTPARPPAAPAADDGFGPIGPGEDPFGDV
jgi:single-strand DNA-binding protein